MENAVISINEFYGEFINKWKIFEKELKTLLKYIELKDYELKKQGTTNHIIRLLTKHEILSKEFTHEISYTMQFRNQLLHNTDILYSKDDISYKTKHLNKIITQLKVLKGKLDEK